MYLISIDHDRELFIAKKIKVDSGRWHNLIVIQAK